MRRLLLLVGLALVFPAAASAHDYDAAGNTAYVGDACGGLYTSPFGARNQWEDCATGLETTSDPQPACFDENGENPSCAYVEVYRQYAHYRRGGPFDAWVLSYYSMRFVGLRDV